MTGKDPGSHASGWDINTKLRWLICAAPCLILLLMGVIGTFQYNKVMVENTEAIAEEGMDTLAQRVRDVFDRAVVLSRAIAARQKALGSFPDSDTRRILRSMLEATPGTDAQGVYVAFEDRPYTDDDAFQWVWRERPPGTPEGAPDVYHMNDKLSYDHHLVNDDHTEWYQGAKATAKGKYFISKLYFDQGNTNVWMVSVTHPIYVEVAGKEKFIGVAGVDLKLQELTDHLQERMEKIPTGTGRGSTKYAYLYSKGLVFALPHRVRNSLGMTGDVAEGKDMRKVLPEIDQVNAEDGHQFLLIKSPATGNRLVSWKRIYDEFDHKIVLSISKAEVDRQAQHAEGVVIAFGLIGLAVMLGVTATIADHYVTRPIKRLTAAAEAVEGGDYDPNALHRLATRRDEFGRLARGFGKMVKEVSGRESQLVKAQEALTHSERHFRALIENAMDIISVVDPNGTMLYESPSICAILGYEATELEGRKIGDLVHPADRDDLMVTLRQLSLGRRSERTTEFRFRHKDGTWRTLEAKCTNLVDDPAVLGIVVNSRDITERKRSEEEIRELNASLDHRIRLRTAELEQTADELRGAKEAAELAMKQTEDFATSMAHDMRNLLQIINGYGEHLLRRAIKKKVDSFIDDLKLIVNKGNELTELLNDLLTQSKAMSGKGVSMDLEEYDVEAMVRERIGGIELIAQKNGNTVEFRPGPNLGMMLADKVKVCRILMNLLTNACKFTQNGTITLSAERVATEAGDQLIFRVIDTGIGMSPKQAEKLFDRFSQVHDPNAHKTMGFGLGLANCMLYCKLMGGQVTVTSEVGQGSTFTVVLPAVVSPQTAALAAQGTPPSRTAAAVEKTTPPAAGASGESANLVLIIDDDSSISDLLRRNLDEEGYQTLSASSGEEGLRLAKQTLPSAIILDVVMPGIDGWAVLAALKTDAQTARIPIIMASMLEESDRGIRMGADAYVNKPFTRDRLAGILHKHLGGRPSPLVLVVGDDPSIRDRLSSPLQEKKWEVLNAADSAEALRLLRERLPDLILLDLPLEKSRGLELVEAIRKNPDWELVPIVVMTSAELSPEDRRALQERVEQVLQKGLYSRETLFQEISTLVEEYRRRTISQTTEEAHA